MGAHRHVLLLVSANRETGWRKRLVRNTAKWITPGCVCQPPEIGFRPVRQELSDGQERTGHVG